jgi:hypothetical protein
MFGRGGSRACAERLMAHVLAGVAQLRGLRVTVRGGGLGGRGLKS